MTNKVVKNGILSAFGSAIVTIIVVAFIQGEAGVPTSLQANVIGNVISAAMSGGISGVVTTILMLREYKLDRQ